MQFSIKKLSKSEVEISFVIPAEEFVPYYEKAILNLGKDFKLEGFRPGNAPREIIERELGEARILEEAANLAIKENYIKTILENKIEAISNPQVEITKIPAPHLPTGRDGAGAKDNPLEFKIKVLVLSEINLPDYKKIASGVKKEKVQIEEKEIEESLKWLQKSRAKFTLKSESCQKGDFVEIKYSSPHIEQGREIKDGFILGEGHFIPGFEEKLEGMQINKEKEFSLDFPKDKKGDFAGKNVDFKVKIINIQKTELPDITDDWAKSLGSFENLEGLRRSISDGILREKEIEANQKRRAEILKKIAENIALEIPEILIETEKKQMLENLKNNVKSQFQINFEDYLAKIQKSEDEIKESFSKDAEAGVKNFLILREIAKRENIEVPEEEIKEKINETLKQYPDIKKVQKGVDLEKLKSYYENAIREEKTLQLLESYANFNSYI